MVARRLPPRSSGHVWLALTLELLLTNTGQTPLHFEEALHAYFKIGDIRDVRLHSLDGIHYRDKTDFGREKVQEGAIAISSETDRVYLDTEGSVELKEPTVPLRRILVAKENSRTTVVWNPWSEKAKSFSDLGDEEWRRMVCVETSNVGDFAVELAQVISTA